MFRFKNGDENLPGEITMFAGEIPMFLKHFSYISHPRNFHPRSFIRLES